MAQTIENPITGERIVFRETGHDTNGELLRLELFMKPGGFVSLEHVHPYQEERFEILAGTLRFTVDRKHQLVGPGDVLAVPPGVRHVFRNAGEVEARLFVEFRPALRSQDVFEAVWGLASSGRLNRFGLPRNPLRMAVIAREFRDEIRPAAPLLRALGLFAPVAAPIGRLLGYGRRPTDRGPGPNS